MNLIELRRLGDQYEDRGDYESAELLYRRALTIQERDLGDEHPALAMDLYNLGLLCYLLEKYNDAESLLMRAWAIERKHLGPVHPETLSTLEALNELYYDANRNADVEYKGLVSARATYGGVGHVYH